MLAMNTAHSGLAPEIVSHEEAAAQKIVAQLRRLRVGQIPFPGRTAYSHGQL